MTVVNKRDTRVGCFDIFFLYKQICKLFQNADAEISHCDMHTSLVYNYVEFIDFSCNEMSVQNIYVRIHCHSYQRS